MTSTLRTGDLITIRLASARVIAADPSRELLVVQTPGGQILSVTVPQPGLHITCLTSGTTPAPTRDGGIEPAAALALPAVLPNSGQGTPTLLVDLAELPPGLGGPVMPRPIQDPALRPDGGEQ